MNLIKFILFGAIISLVLGEFGQQPFGMSGAVYLADILLVACYLLLFIWQINQGRKLQIIRLFTPPLFSASNLLIMFILTCFVSLVWSLMMIPVDEVLKGGLYLIRFSLYAGLFFLIKNVSQEFSTWQEDLSKILIGIGTLLAIIGFIQLIIFPNLTTLEQLGFDPHQGRLVSTWLDPNFLGIFLVFIFNLTLGKFLHLKKKGWVVLLMILGAAIILTYSRTAYLVWLVSLLAIGILKWRKLLIGLVITVILIGVFIPRVYERVSGGILIDQSASERFSSWQNGFKIWQEYPTSGVGFNNLRYVQVQNNLIKSYSLDGGHSGGGIDSSLIFVLATTGMLGAFFYCLFWLKTLLILRKKNVVLFGSMLGLLVGSQFVNAMFFPPIMLIYFSLLGDVERV